MRCPCRLIAGVCLVLLGVGCQPDRTGWFTPDWGEVLEREARGRADDLEVNPPRFAAPPALPDFGDTGAAPVELSVEQAVLVALLRNRDLAVQQLTPEIVGAFEQIERGRFDPELFGEASFTREETSETARSTGAQFGVVGEDTAAAAGVRQTLPTGTDIELAVEQGRSISNRAPEQQEARVGLSVTQSLLRGLGPSVNLASVRQAELDTLASRFELRGYTEALLADVETAYWNYVRADRQIAILDRALEVARSQRDAVELRIQVGDLAATQASAARVEVAIREQALINGRSDREAARLRLLRLLNAGELTGPGPALRPVTAPDLRPTPITDDADHVLAAHRFRPDLREAQLRLEQGRLETLVTRNGLLPRLEVFIALGKTGFADTFTDSFRELDGQTYDATVGVRFSQLLGNRAAQGRDRAARATRQQQQQAVDNLRQLVALDVRLALTEVRRAAEQITASAATRQLQEETVRAELERFDVGSSTTLQVAQAQRDLLTAQLNEVEAVISYRLARINLALAEGTLLDARGITVTSP